MQPKLIFRFTSVCLSFFCFVNSGNTTQLYKHMKNHKENAELQTQRKDERNPPTLNRGTSGNISLNFGS